MGEMCKHMKQVSCAWNGRNEQECDACNREDLEEQGAVFVKGKAWDFELGGVKYVDWGNGRRRKVIQCACRDWVVCAGFTNTCRCGRDFNMSGQELASRCQWGEETGESVQDILAADID